MIKPEFWRGKRVFLTGHTGFKGAWATLLLRYLGAQIYGYSLAPTTTPSLFELIGGKDALHAHHVADIGDGEALGRAMKAFQPDIVIHMAAQSLVRRSYRDPAETFAVNVMGTVHVLEAIRATPSITAAIIVTTDKVYDLSSEVSPRKESDPLGGHDPYSASKAAAEILTQSYRQSFFSGPPDFSRARVATVRSGNVIGGGDWSEDRIVPDVVSSLLAGREIVLRYPESIRPWLFVLDTLTGYLMLAEQLFGEKVGFASAWNFGPAPGEEMRVRDLVEVFAQAWGVNGGWRRGEETPLPEAPQLRLDPARAMTELGWKPSLSQREAISETAEWYHAFLRGKANGYAVSQDAIIRHLARITHH